MTAARAARPRSRCRARAPARPEGVTRSQDRLPSRAPSALSSGCSLKPRVRKFSDRHLRPALSLERHRLPGVLCAPLLLLPPLPALSLGDLENGFFFHFPLGLSVHLCNPAETNGSLQRHTDTQSAFSNKEQGLGHARPAQPGEIIRCKLPYQETEEQSDARVICHGWEGGKHYTKSNTRS